MIRLAELGANVGVVSGTVGLVVSQIPSVPLPAGFSEWPAQTLMAFVALSSMGIMCFVFKQHLKTASDSARAMSDSAVALSRVADEQKQSNGLQKETNKLLTQTVTKLDMRPCMAEDLMEMMKSKTQKIRME
jgi:hypothetical protein